MKMNILDIYGVEKKHNVALHAVAKKLRLSEQSIISILKDAGFDFYGMPYVILNERHLKVLSKSYAEAIKNYHKNVGKKFYEFSKEEQIHLKKFFSKFIKFSEFYEFYLPEIDDEKILNSKLDTSLINVFFYNLIHEVEYDYLYSTDSAVKGVNESNAYNRILCKVKLKIKSSFNSIKSKLFSILKTCHYYIFSDDEDHILGAKFKKCFSIVINLSRGALNSINNLKFDKKWKEFSYS